MKMIWDNYNLLIAYAIIVCITSLTFNSSLKATHFPDLMAPSISVKLILSVRTSFRIRLLEKFLRGYLYTKFDQ